LRNLALLVVRQVVIAVEQVAGSLLLLSVMCSKVSIRFRICAFFCGDWLLKLRSRSSR